VSERIGNLVPDWIQSLVDQGVKELLLDEFRLFHGEGVEMRSFTPLLAAIPIARALEREPSKENCGKGSHLELWGGIRG
jgi:hypothetical protein